MNTLTEILREEIRDQGPISFARFMEMALYCPNLGYYERRRETVGRGGDFFTSVSVGALFGELLGFQFAAWFDEQLAKVGANLFDGSPAAQRSRTSASRGAARSPFQIVEAGAHDGRLALDILTWFRQHRPDLFGMLEYWILEPSGTRQQWQAQALREFDERVRWFHSWDLIPSRCIRGVIFANELLDAFPVHRLGWNANDRDWFEWGVSCEEDQFVWVKLTGGKNSTGRTEKSSSWPRLPDGLLAVLPDGFTTEISPTAEMWWGQAAAALEQGKLMTIDYGLLAEDFFTQQRAEGTLRAFRSHHASSNLLDCVGEQDLTSHVNFSELRRSGERAGLQTEALISQSKFLTEIVAGINHSPQSFESWTTERNRQLQTLIHPEHLGRPFRVLIQSAKVRD